MGERRWVVHPGVGKLEGYELAQVWGWQVGISEWLAFSNLGLCSKLVQAFAESG